jgi:poly(3-hydroxybutyrate) depolymerase
MTKPSVFGAIAVLVSVAALAASGQQAAPDNLAAIAPLLGKWTGASEGQPGNGSTDREYERMLGSRFIRARNRTTYPPQEKNPKGERHEDEGVFSFDRARKRIVLRQFHAEGFVNTYVQDLEAKPGTLSFTTDAIENIPAGWRARETYLFHGPDEVEEVFELAEAGKPFSVYSRVRLKRVK